MNIYSSCPVSFNMPYESITKEMYLNWQREHNNVKQFKN